MDARDACIRRRRVAAAAAVAVSHPAAARAPTAAAATKHKIDSAPSSLPFRSGRGRHGWLIGLVGMRTGFVKQPNTVLNLILS